MHVYRYEIMNTLNLLHPRLSPHRLCGTSCTWAHEPKYAIYHKAIKNHHLAQNHRAHLTSAHYILA